MRFKEDDEGSARATVNWGTCCHGSCVPDARMKDFVFCLCLLLVNHIAASQHLSSRVFFFSSSLWRCFTLIMYKYQLALLSTLLQVLPMLVSPHRVGVHFFSFKYVNRDLRGISRKERPRSVFLFLHDQEFTHNCQSSSTEGAMKTHSFDTFPASCLKFETAIDNTITATPTAICLKCHISLLYSRSWDLLAQQIKVNVFHVSCVQIP